MAGEYWTWQEAHELFTLYNNRYFRNRLPHCEVAFKPHNFTQGLGLFRNKVVEQEGVKGVLARKYSIYISNRIKWSASLWAMTLLHEMVHLDIHTQMVKNQEIHKWNKRTGHGPSFQKEMKRLAAMGAFVGVW